jgi:hypothetical protein
LLLKVQIHKLETKTTSASCPLVDFRVSIISNSTSSTLTAPAVDYTTKQHSSPPSSSAAATYSGKERLTTRWDRPPLYSTTTHYADLTEHQSSRPVLRLPTKKGHRSQSSLPLHYRDEIKEKVEEDEEGQGHYHHRIEIEEYPQGNLDLPNHHHHNNTRFESGYALEHSSAFRMNSSAVPRSPGDPVANFRSPFDFGQQQAAFNAQHAASLRHRDLNLGVVVGEGEGSNESSNESDALRENFSTIFT